MRGGGGGDFYERTDQDEQSVGLEGALRRIVREEIQAILRGTSTDRLLTAEQAAALLSCSPDYLYRRVKSFPFARRIGRMVRFSERGIFAYIESKRSSKSA